MPPTAEYSPVADGRPDPGEVVWTWVAYEEDASRGKDRPVLVLARNGAELLCLQLTSKDHDRDAAQEASWGRHWTDVGAGGWDRARRPSEVRLDRVLRVREADVRREGAALDRAVFDRVVAEASAFHPELAAGASGRSAPSTSPVDPGKGSGLRTAAQRVGQRVGQQVGQRVSRRRSSGAPRRTPAAVGGAASALGRQAAQLVVSLVRRRR